VKETKYRADIQALRGLAVLAVILFHAYEDNFPDGYLGVDVFFVISGFVVTPLILRVFTDQNISTSRLLNLIYFYQRRFYRLAPALAVMLTISAVLVFLLITPMDHERFSKQGIATILLLGNLGAYKYAGNYFSPNPNPLVHTWSLSVEEQIYILLPLIFVLILHKRNSITKIILGLLTLITTLSMTSFLFPTIMEPFYFQVGILTTSQISFYSPIDRIWQFTIGGLAYLLLKDSEKCFNKDLRNIHLLIIVALAVFLLGSLHPNTKISSVIVSLLTVTIIATKSLNILPHFVIRKFEWLGDRSYSIYLVHMPLMFIAKYSTITAIGDGKDRKVETTVALIASILLGALSYAMVENRFRSRGQNQLIGLKQISVAVIFTVATPLAIFASMNNGSINQYWGLDRNIPIPAYAGNLDPNCFRDSISGPPCIYKVTRGTKSVLLIGDSYAGQLSQALIDAAKIENWNTVVWTHSGCNVTFQQDINRQVSENCVDTNKQMEKWVLENRPDAIIVAQHVKPESNQKDLRNALITLKSIVPNILLIENNPVFPDGEFMVPRALVLSPYQPPKAFNLSSMQTSDKNASNQLALWAKNNGFSTLDFSSLFCDTKSCSRFEEEGWLYRDGNHFSVLGATKTIPQLRTFLRRF